MHGNTSGADRQTNKQPDGTGGTSPTTRNPFWAFFGSNIKDSQIVRILHCLRHGSQTELGCCLYHRGRLRSGRETDQVSNSEEQFYSRMGVFAFWPVVFVFVPVALLKYVVLFLFVFSYFLKLYFVLLTHKYAYKTYFSVTICKHMQKYLIILINSICFICFLKIHCLMLNKNLPRK